MIAPLPSDTAVPLLFKDVPAAKKFNPNRTFYLALLMTMRFFCLPLLLLAIVDKQKK
jgi:hypothetical protein